MKSNIKPLHDRVIVEPEEVKKETQSGLIIPDTAKERPLKGTAIKVGNGKLNEPMTVKEGDGVLYGKHAGGEIEIDGKKYLIMRESEILAIV